MPKKALGRGIDALLQTQETAAEKQVSEISIDSLQPNPDQPRKEFNEERIAELSESIQQQGIIQPLVVEQRNDNYVIIAGERRYRAAKLAGVKSVPVIIREFTQEEKLEIALVENIQREDLNPLEEAQAFSRLIEVSGLNQEDLAHKVGKKRSTIANSLRLLKLPRHMQEGLLAGRMSSGHARALLAVTNPADRDLLYERISRNGLSVREAEAAAQELNKGGRASKKTSGASVSHVNPDPELRSLEEQFLTALGTKVKINGTQEKGKIEIAYYSMDDLQRVYEMIAEK